MVMDLLVIRAMPLPYLISTKGVVVVRAYKADHKKVLRSKLSGSDCFPHGVRENSFGFEPGQFRKDAGLGSRGQCDDSGNNVAVD